jgi:hypothetical protein
VAPVCCEGLYLEDIIQDFQAKCTRFPMKYLELPLSVTQLKIIHFQPLEDKVAAKLIPWIGRHVTMADRSTLVKAVLTCIDIYFVIVSQWRCK